MAARAREEAGQTGQSCELPGAGAVKAGGGCSGSIRAGGSCSGSIRAGQSDSGANTSSMQQGPAGTGSPGSSSAMYAAGGLGQITELAQLVLRCPAPADACLKYASACATNLITAMQGSACHDRHDAGRPGREQRLLAVAGPAAVSGSLAMSSVAVVAEAGGAPRADADGQQLMARLKQWQRHLLSQHTDAAGPSC